MAGVPTVEQVAQKVESLYQRRYDIATEVTITAGATQALQQSPPSFIRETKSSFRAGL